MRSGSRQHRGEAGGEGYGQPVRTHRTGTQPSAGQLAAPARPMASLIERAEGCYSCLLGMAAALLDNEAAGHADRIAGWLARAEALRDRVLSKQESAWVFFKQGRLAELTGDPDTAAARYRQAWAVYPHPDVDAGPALAASALRPDCEPRDQARRVDEGRRDDMDGEHDLGGAGLGGAAGGEAGVRVPGAEGKPFGRAAGSRVARGGRGGGGVDDTRVADDGEARAPGAAVPAGVGGAGRSAEAGQRRPPGVPHRARAAPEGHGPVGVAQALFRSSFRDWTAEETDHPREVVEAALAHAVRNPVKAAFARSGLFERRRRLMDDWAAYLGGRRTTGKSRRR